MMLTVCAAIISNSIHAAALHFHRKLLLWHLSCCLISYGLKREGGVISLVKIGAVCGEFTSIGEWKNSYFCVTHV